MPSSVVFNIVDSGSRQDDFLGSPAEVWQDSPYLGLVFAASPDQLSKPLSDLDSSFIWTQPSFTYPSAREVASQSDPHASFEFHDGALQTDIQPLLEHDTSVFNSQTLPIVVPITHQLSVTLDAGRSLVYNNLQAFPSAVGSSPVHNVIYYPQDHSTWKLSQYDGSQVSAEPFNSTMGTPYQQIQPAPTDVVPGSPSVPSDLALQPMVSRFPPPRVAPTRRKPRGNRSVTSSPYHPLRTSSLPAQSVLGKETGICCQWISEDGAVCGGHITSGTVSQHLRIHDIQSMAHDRLVSCRWLGCRLRRDKAMMNRESIVRHLREKHLGCRRTL